MPRYFLSTYSIRLKNKKDSKYVNLSSFDNKKDFFKIFVEFLLEIGRETQEYENRKLDIKKCLTLNDENGMIQKSKERTVHGFFASGVSGDERSVSQLENKKLKVVSVIGKDKYIGKPIFYYLKVPNTGSVAYFILQRESSYGIKELFKRFFVEYMKRSLLFENYTFEIGESLNTKLFNHIIDSGRLVELSIVKKGLPSRWDDLADPEKQEVISVGKMKTIVVSERNKSLPFKELARNLFKRKKTKEQDAKVVEIFGEYEEVDFEFDLNGSRKTFHMAKGNQAPDFDVSSKIDSRNLLRSFKEESEILILDMEKDYEGLS